MVDLDPTRPPPIGDASSSWLKRSRNADGTEADQRAANRISNIEDFDNIIIVLVGPRERRFSLHQDVICDKSKFSRAACSKHWAEGIQKLVRLPEVKAKVYQNYCKWIYSGVIPVSRVTAGSGADESRTEQDLFFSLDLIGDVLDDIQLRNLATQGLYNSIKAGGHFPGTEMIAKIWSSTPPGSLVKKMLVDSTSSWVETGSFTECVASNPPEYVQAVVIAALRVIGTSADVVLELGNVSQYLEPEKPKDDST